MATRYENVISNWHSNDVNAEAILQANTFPVFEIWFLNMLGEWHVADPVSQKEINRNNEIYSNYQHNRNPYIDHPEYVNAVWGVGTSGVLSATPASLSGFTYSAGTGPSVSQNYNLSGSALTPASGTITVSGNASFEVSADNATFNSSINITYSGSTLGATVIYVRLKSGLATGTYNNALVANSGGGATTFNVTCNGSVSAGILPEPTNYSTNFSAQNIHLQWTDATGAVVPTGYLVRMSATGFVNILNPADGTIYPNSSTDQNVLPGAQEAWFKNLNTNTTYYFKLFGYTGSGTGIDYKTDGSVPQIQQSTGL